MGYKRRNKINPGRRRKPMKGRDKRMAPQVGLEPTTLRLTAGCSAIELLRSVGREKARFDSNHLIITFALPSGNIGLLWHMALSARSSLRPVRHLTANLGQQTF